MSIEAQLASLEAALKENTAALNAVLAAGGSSPSNVVAIISETTKPATKKAEPAPEPAPTPAPEPEPVTETPTKVDAPAPESDEFSDPLDPDTKVVVQGDPAPPKIDVDATIKEITDTWKTMLSEADADRKAMLKDKFPAIRAKWGLAADAKLISLAPTPEKLVGLLADIKAL